MKDSGLICTTIEAGEAGRRRGYRLALAAVCLLLCLPIWGTRYVPLVDYPNHLARAYILSNYETVPSYGERYDRLVSPIPNVALDVVMLLLLKLFNVLTAGKIFLTATVLLLAFGCHLLGQAIHGRPSWLALPCAFLSYNSMLFFGFLNYLFGLGLFLATFSLWLRHRGSWRAVSFISVCLLASGCYLAHLSAYVFLAVAVFVVACFDFWSGERSVRGLVAKFLPLLPPLVAFKLFMGGSGTVGEIAWSGVLKKLLNSVSWVITYNYILDALCACLVLAAVLMLTGRMRGLRVNPAVFAAAVGFCLAFLASPEKLFTSHSADVRFILPAVLLGLMSLRFCVPARIGVLALSLVLVAEVVRLGGVWYDWHKLDQTISAQVSLFGQLPEDTSVYPLILFPSELGANKRQRPLAHIIHYATIERHTYSPTLFALRGQQPLLFRDQFTYYPFNLNGSAAPDVELVNWQLIFDNHDYLWGYNLSDSYIAFLKENCVLVSAAGGGIIFRVDHARRLQSAERGRPVASVLTNGAIPAR